MKFDRVDGQISEEEDAFGIIHDYRRKYFLKQRNSFYEKRRKEKKMLMKKMQKAYEMWKQREKQLEYVNKFLVFEENSKSQEAQLLYSKEYVSTSGQEAEQKQKLTTVEIEEFGQIQKKYIFQDRFESFSFF